MLNYFVFNDYDSRDYKVILTREGVYNAPKRTYNAVSVPGRSGDLVISQNRLENINVTYPCRIPIGFDDNLTALKSALLSTKGYARLTDSFHTDEFRLGYFVGGTSVSPRIPGDMGDFTLTFVCKPQRFLTSGESVTTLSADGTITNPTLFPAKPLIRVYGSGTLTIGEDEITIASHSYSYCDIDCEIMDCFYGSNNLNSFVTFATGDFPELAAGETAITLDGITRIEITPNWWRV